MARVFAAASIGFCLDTLWIRVGVLDYAGASVAPVWIVLLWVGVGLSVNHSLAPFGARPWVGGLLAGLTAPVSYLGGERRRHLPGERGPVPLQGEVAADGDAHPG